jgi:hypothetical protein
LKLLLEAVQGGPKAFSTVLRYGYSLCLAISERFCDLALLLSKVLRKVGRCGIEEYSHGLRYAFRLTRAILGVLILCHGCGLVLGILERLRLPVAFLLVVLVKVVHSGGSFFLEVLCPPGRREWFVLGSLQGIRISAVPDTGSDLDIVSDDFIKRHGIQIDSTSQKFIQLPNGKVISTGTVSLLFSFKGEKSTFSRVFTIMLNCLHDVILSNLFLRTTETLTRFSSRLKSKFVPLLHAPRLRVLGAPK